MLTIDFADVDLALKIDNKTKTFRLTAKALERGVLSHAPVWLAENGCEASARAYWLLNLAYKHQQLEPGVLTNTSKRAALQACGIMAVRPFVPDDPDAISDIRVELANPFLCFYAGSAVIGPPRLKATDDEREYLYKLLLSLRFPSLDPFVASVNRGEDQSRLSYGIALSEDELLAIDTVIYRFEAMARQR